MIPQKKINLKLFFGYLIISLKNFSKNTISLFVIDFEFMLNFFRYLFVTII
jgi:hypothetical protein